MLSQRSSLQDYLLWSEKRAVGVTFDIMVTRKGSATLQAKSGRIVLPGNGGESVLMEAPRLVLVKG